MVPVGRRKMRWSISQTESKPSCSVRAAIARSSFQGRSTGRKRPTFSGRPFGFVIVISPFGAYVIGTSGPQRPAKLGIVWRNRQARRRKTVAFKVVATPFRRGVRTDYPHERESLDPIGAQIPVIEPDSDAEWLAQAKDADAVIVGGRRLTGDLIRGLDKCKVFAS